MNILKKALEVCNRSLRGDFDHLCPDPIEREIKLIAIVKRAERYEKVIATNS